MIYFDSAATSFQKPPAVRGAVERAMRTCASVGRGGHRPAINAAQTVFDCRELAAELFDCEAEQVAFTMNATHGLNIAIRTLVPEGGRVVLSGFEHNAVTRPLHALHAEQKIAGRVLFSPQDTLESFENALKSSPCAVICNYVSNVFGYVLPIQGIAALCRLYEVPLIIDASQAAGTLPVSLRHTGARFIAMPGHKGLYGPQGTGLLLCSEGAEPLLFGGTGSVSIGQDMPEFLPDRLEAGTHNVPGIAGLAAGLQYVRMRTPEKIWQKERTLAELLRKQLPCLPRIRPFFGQAQGGVVSFVIDGMDCEEAAQKLSQQAVAVRAGVHCAPLAHQSAGTLDSGTVRVSFSDFNTPQEVTAFLRICKKLFSS